MAVRRPQSRLASFVRDDRGAVAVEYGLLLMMIGLALIGMASLTDVSNQISNTFQYLADTIAR